MFQRVITYVKNKEGKVIAKKITIRKSNALKYICTSEKVLKAEMKDTQFFHE